MRRPFMPAGAATLLAAVLFLSGCEERVTDPGPQAAVKPIALGPPGAAPARDSEARTQPVDQVDVRFATPRVLSRM